ncbi:MAG TPA: penicillin-binding protein 2 [Gammaproteobacteria bacterium]|nr:penicillin-binding protein 2 [Gammaproteobacteria bacterium]
MNSLQSPQQVTFSRHLVVWGVLLSFSVILSWRLTDLQIISDDFLQEEGNKRSLRTIPLSSHRGLILDRNGEALAISTQVHSVWVNPKEIEDGFASKWNTLCELLSLDPSVAQAKILRKKDRSFVYLKRHISPQLAQKIDRLNLPGIHLQNEYRRFYPNAEVSAHVLGFTDIDHRGQEGLEFALDSILSGSPGRKTILKDRLGAQIESREGNANPLPGQDVQLSIDSRIQYLAYRELLKAVKKNNAKAGSVVILDADTFEVIAMANVPSFNPNLIERPLDGSARNRAVTDQFEPGSLIKPFSMAHILASGRFYPHSPVDTNPGWLKVGNRLVRDVRNFGFIDVGTVLQKSSNVGITKLILSLPPEKLYKTYQDLGFGDTTHSGFPGEAMGHLEYAGIKNPFALATLAFGYGISATPLQIAQAYAILAARGVKRPISYLKVEDTPPGEQVLSPGIASAITRMLISATQTEGTAHNAYIPGYIVAGKTGTARKIGAQGYDEDSHLALFAGFAPAQDPKLVMVVIIDEPSAGRYYGGEVAAPVFARVMQGALRLSNIAPFRSDVPELLLVKK